ncbi:hypothetical protein AURDEDRAFT_165548 [Auricularia subglabra TFB-10046 SS5]|nr:hypothetical protein AURDEDRAFT_165548 [Auricularia subglabra TFB-10046 SS5]
MIAYLVTSIILLHAIRIDVAVVAILSAVSLFVYIVLAYLPFGARNGSVIASHPIIKQCVLGALAVIMLLWIVPVVQLRRTLRETCLPDNPPDPKCPRLRAIRVAGLVLDALYIAAAVSATIVQYLWPWSPRHRAFARRCGVRHREEGNVFVCCCIEMPEDDAACCVEVAGCCCALLEDEEEREGEEEE